MLDPSAYEDSFARDHLPPENLWPEMPRDLPDFSYPKRLNAAVALLDAMIAKGFGPSPCIRASTGAVWTYADLRDRADRIAAVLVDDYGLRPGNRVLLRAANSPMLAAAWFAVLKAGGIVVTTMPLLRARELAYTIAKAKVGLAICDTALGEDLEAARAQAPDLRAIAYFNTPDPAGLEARMAAHAAPFANVIPSHDDVALIAFTSGTTGKAKATVHFHRDVLAICDGFARSVVKPEARGHLHRHAAAGLHVWPGRIAAVPAALRRLDRDAGKGEPAAPAAGDSGSQGHHRVHRADHVSGHDRSGGRLRHFQPEALRLGRRASARSRARTLACGNRHHHHRRDRLDRDAAHLRHHARRRYPSRMRPAARSTAIGR